MLAVVWTRRKERYLIDQSKKKWWSHLTVSQLTRNSIDEKFISFIMDFDDPSFDKLINAPIVISCKTSHCCWYRWLSSVSFDRSRSILMNNSINLRTAFCSHKYGIIAGDRARFFIKPTVALIMPQCSLKFLSRNNLMIVPMPYDFLMISRASFSRSCRAVICRSVPNWRGMLWKLVWLKKQQASVLRQLQLSHHFDLYWS